MSLKKLAAPGWTLRDKHPRGPWAEGPTHIWAPTFEEVVWRTWCHFFGWFAVADTVAYPPMPSDWMARIVRAQEAWRDAQTHGLHILQDTAP